MTQTKPMQKRGAPKAGGVDQRPIIKPKNVEEAIAHAGDGRVAVDPAMAVEMAGRLYSEGKFAQAERVCRQIIKARPEDANAHNIRGVALNALGHREAGLEALRKAAELAPTAANVQSNLGEVKCFGSTVSSRRPPRCSNGRSSLTLTMPRP
jgi:tetratricopeptide (TPR) repeat protein